MTYAAALASIEQRFATAWGTTTPVQWPNRNYEPQPGNEWVRLTVLDGDSTLVGLGLNARLYTHPGVILVGIFVPKGNGERRSAVLVDSVSEIWRGVEFDGILCRAPAVTRVGLTGEWFQTNVSVPFQRDGVL